MERATFRGVVVPGRVAQKESISAWLPSSSGSLYAQRGNVTTGPRGTACQFWVPIAGPESASEDGTEELGGDLCDFK